MQYNPDEYKEILAIFKTESEEIIQSLNDGFLELEKNPENKTPLKKLLQNAHSLKGSARMLGFNSIQDIAHKLEDILSFWNKEDAIIEIASFNIIYDVCDFLFEAVTKSVENQSDYFDINIVKILNALDGFTQGRNETKPNEDDNFKSNISSQLTDINAAMLELMFVLNKDDDIDNPQDILMVISDNLSIIFDIFKNSNYDDIKNRITAINEKLLSDSPQENIFSLIKEEFVILKTEIYKELNIVLPKINTQQPKSTVKTSNDNIDAETEENFDYLVKHLLKIKNDKTFIEEIKPRFDIIKKKTSNIKVKNIISEIISILDLFQATDSPIDNECYMTILQGIYLARKTGLDGDEIKLSHLNSFSHRLNVIKDLLTNNNQKVKEQIHVTEDGAVFSKNNVDLDLVKKKLNFYEMQEIKTLRVDTAKIDNLVSQTGELLINGIKNREHLSEISLIHSKFAQLNNDNKKILNYIKYLEKRGFFDTVLDESSSLFYRKIQNFIVSNSNTFMGLQNDFASLYNMVLEDDNNLNQTAIEIENIAKGIRILPLATIFHSFPRMIRDIALEHNKKIDFIVTGSDTTVDKKLIEEIKMPLIHILRNAVSHGIEEPQERIKNGKSETGIVKLTATQENNSVVLVIEDDGYGINIEKIKNRAITNGILAEDEVEKLSNEQLTKLLFLPGFSTNELIDEISGRGIGLDIVKTKINNLQGVIQIDSQLNHGCKVTIKLPLSMSTLHTFVILVNEQKYAIPVSSIKFVKRVKKEEIFVRNGINYIIHDDHSVSIYSISEVLGEKYINTANKELTVIIIENQGQQAAFIVDELLGDFEIFHKKLIAPIIKIKNISGFTTLSTGEICLIINPYELIMNTQIDSALISFDVKQIENAEQENSYSTKKVLLLNDGRLDYLKSDLLKEFENVESLTNIYNVYEYIQKNEIDVFICKIGYEDTDVLKFLQYIKNDESYSGIKIVTLSDLTSLEVLTILNHFKPDLQLRTSDYTSEMFIKSIKKII